MGADSIHVSRYSNSELRCGGADWVRISRGISTNYHLQLPLEFGAAAAADEAAAAAAPAAAAEARRWLPVAVTGEI